MKDDCKYCTGTGRDPVEVGELCPVCSGYGYLNYYAEPDQAPLSWKQTFAIVGLAAAVIFMVLVMGGPA